MNPSVQMRFFADVFSDWTYSAFGGKRQLFLRKSGEKSDRVKICCHGEIFGDSLRVKPECCCGGMRAE